MRYSILIRLLWSNSHFISIGQRTTYCFPRRVYLLSLWLTLSTSHWRHRHVEHSVYISIRCESSRWWNIGVGSCVHHFIEGNLKCVTMISSSYVKLGFWELTIRSWWQISYSLSSRYFWCLNFDPITLPRTLQLFNSICKLVITVLIFPEFLRLRVISIQENPNISGSRLAGSYHLGSIWLLPFLK